MRRPMTLKDYLRQSAISQEQFGRLLGVRQATVSKLAARLYQPSLPVAEKIIRLSGGKVTLRELAKK